MKRKTKQNLAVAVLCAFAAIVVLCVWVQLAA